MGLSCVHVLEADAAVTFAAGIKSVNPGITVLVGGHAASTYPLAIAGSTGVDAIVVGEGEATMPAVCDVLERGQGFEFVPGLLLPDASRTSRPTVPSSKTGTVPAMVSVETSVPQ